jgi:hypothetical protein
MYHTIEFTSGGILSLHPPGRRVLTPVLVLPGTRIRAEIRAAVIDTMDGPVEVADLLLEDGSRAPRLPYAFFSFVEPP